MNNTNTGGPAFPSTYTHTDGRTFHEDGMDLRDYFAAKAMSALVTCGVDVAYDIAKTAYIIADAMLATREAS